MNDPDKKENREQTEPDKHEAVPLTPDELEQVTGGAGFWFFDKERRKPKG